MAEARRAVPVRLIFATALASGLTPLNSTMLSVVLRPVGATFQQSEGALTRALVTSYLVTSIVMQAPGGKIGDQLGHRKTLMLGQAAFALGALCGLLAPSVNWLIAARVTMATAGALIVPSATALLRTELPIELRGRAFGAFGACMALSAALGPVLGGQLTSHFGWRAVFAINLVLLPISALLAGAPRAEKDERKRSGFAQFDFAGTALLGAGLAAFALGIRRGGAPNFALLGAAPLLLAGFVAVEKRARSPVVDLSILRQRVFVASGGIIALHNLAMYALLFELPSVAGVVLGASASQSGPLLVAVLAPMVVLSPIAGRLTDRVGARAVAMTGTSAAAAGMIALLLTGLTSRSALLPGLTLFGVGLGLSSAPSQSSGMSAVAAHQSGVAAGMLSTMRYLGGIAGTLVLSVLLSETADPGAVRAAHRSLLLVFLLALSAAVGCALCLPSRTAAASKNLDRALEKT